MFLILASLCRAEEPNLLVVETPTRKAYILKGQTFFPEIDTPRVYKTNVQVSEGVSCKVQSRTLLPVSESHMARQRIPPDVIAYKAINGSLLLVTRNLKFLLVQQQGPSRTFHDKTLTQMGFTVDKAFIVVVSSEKDSFNFMLVSSGYSSHYKADMRNGLIEKMEQLSINFATKLVVEIPGQQAFYLFEQSGKDINIHSVSYTLQNGTLSLQIATKLQSSLSSYLLNSFDYEFQLVNGKIWLYLLSIDRIFYLQEPFQAVMEAVFSGYEFSSISVEGNIVYLSGKVLDIREYTAEAYLGTSDQKGKGKGKGKEFALNRLFLEDRWVRDTQIYEDLLMSVGKNDIRLHFAGEYEPQTSEERLVHTFHSEIIFADIVDVRRVNNTISVKVFAVTQEQVTFVELEVLPLKLVCTPSQHTAIATVKVQQFMSLCPDQPVSSLIQRVHPLVQCRVDQSYQLIAVGHARVRLLYFGVMVGGTLLLLLLLLVSADLSSPHPQFLIQYQQMGGQEFPNDDSKKDCQEQKEGQKEEKVEVHEL